MASVASPYGLKPVNELGGLPYAGSTRSFLFDPAGYNANVYNGSLVYVKSTGYVEIVSATGADATTNGFPVGTANTGAVGVFVGCSYTNTQGQTVFAQYYPANALNGVALVVDDDRCVFQVQSAGSVTQAALGANTFFSTGAVLTGSTSTGNSTASVVAGSGAVTTTAAFRIVGFVNMVGFSTVGDAYTDILVKFNPGYHSYSNAVGL
jgi:hypothetical protein|tara:strand:- start:841 stop:1464 length:624 start_codon:yes stop_codon:yes gene_type:complete